MTQVDKEYFMKNSFFYAMEDYLIYSNDEMKKKKTTKERRKTKPKSHNIIRLF